MINNSSIFTASSNLQNNGLIDELFKMYQRVMMRAVFRKRLDIFGLNIVYIFGSLGNDQPFTTDISLYVYFVALHKQKM